MSTSTLPQRNPEVKASSHIRVAAAVLEKVLHGEIPRDAAYRGLTEEMRRLPDNLKGAQPEAYPLVVAFCYAVGGMETMKHDPGEDRRVQLNK